jgi:hypothetical protein
MSDSAVLPPIKTQLRVALLNLTAYREIPTPQLIAAVRALPGGTKVHCPDRITAIVLLLGTRLVDLD